MISTGSALLNTAESSGGRLHFSLTIGEWENGKTSIPKWNKTKTKRKWVAKRKSNRKSRRKLLVSVQWIRIKAVLTVKLLLFPVETPHNCARIFYHNLNCYCGKLQHSNITMVDQRYFYVNCNLHKAHYCHFPSPPPILEENCCRNSFSARVWFRQSWRLLHWKCLMLAEFSSKWHLQRFQFASNAAIPLWNR